MQQQDIGKLPSRGCNVHVTGRLHLTMSAEQVDERYFATVLAMNGRQGEASKPGLLTYVDWSVVAVGGHPRNFKPEETSPALLREVRLKSCPEAADSARAAAAARLLHSYEGDDDDGGGGGRGSEKFAPAGPACFLFARKFHGETAAAVLALFRHESFHRWNYTAGLAAT
jgi:hypothetical protein